MNSILVPFFVFALGYMPDAMMPDLKMYNHLFQTDITVGVEVKEFLTIQGRIVTSMTAPDDLPYFEPYQDDYYIGAHIEHNGWKLEFMHLCSHPVFYRGTMYQEERGHNKFSFSYDSRRGKQ